MNRLTRIIAVALIALGFAAGVAGAHPAIAGEIEVPINTEPSPTGR